MRAKHPPFLSRFPCKWCISVLGARSIHRRLGEVSPCLNSYLFTRLMFLIIKEDVSLFRYTETYCFIKGSYYLPLDDHFSEDFIERDNAVSLFVLWTQLVVSDGYWERVFICTLITMIVQIVFFICRWSATINGCPLCSPYRHLCSISHQLYGRPSTSAQVGIIDT